MSSTISVSRSVSLRIVETFSDALPGDATVTFDPQADASTFTASTTVAVSKYALFSAALSGGAATIDLTALPGQGANQTIDGTGLKVQLASFRNPSTNANAITLTFGAANGYLLLGAGWSITLAPGQSTGPLSLIGAAPTIGGSAKNIDLSGTGTQALDVELVMG